MKADCAIVAGCCGIFNCACSIIPYYEPRPARCIAGDDVGFVGPWWPLATQEKQAGHFILGYPPMFTVDDMLLTPMRRLAAILRATRRIRRQRLKSCRRAEAKAVVDLQRRLESGRIGEKDFDAEEDRLLEHVEELTKVLHQHEVRDVIEDDASLPDDTVP